MSTGLKYAIINIHNKEYRPFGATNVFRARQKRTSKRCINIITNRRLIETMNQYISSGPHSLCTLLDFASPDREGFFCQDSITFHKFVKFASIRETGAPNSNVLLQSKISHLMNASTIDTNINMYNSQHMTQQR